MPRELIPAQPWHTGSLLCKTHGSALEEDFADKWDQASGLCECCPSEGYVSTAKAAARHLGGHSDPTSLSFGTSITRLCLFTLQELWDAGPGLQAQLLSPSSCAQPLCSSLAVSAPCFLSFPAWSVLTSALQLF